MSLLTTVILGLVAFASTVLTLYKFPRLGSANAFWGFFLGFCAAVAAAIGTNFHNPNAGRAVLYGIITALVATPVIALMSISFVPPWALFHRRALQCT